jgi:hypothetical protein
VEILVDFASSSSSPPPCFMSQMAYVVSAHKPTSVRHAVSCSFLSPASRNLILAYSCCCLVV